jgi:Asp-tRNA(Asn)/Glu-tRNA(Gln) amidotransferase A subunit family amidase
MQATSRLETFAEWRCAGEEWRRLGVNSCLERIDAIDSSIRAWVQVLPQKPTRAGALSGIPFGAKDIIETEGLKTEYGSPIYKGRTGRADAAIIRELRGRGAILLGKTHTAAFAYRDPPPTRNPRNLEHTPGGSSSGSAAAVAAGTAPFALGTQTKGSVLRPASYCGVTGFKPSHGRFSLDGVLQMAKSLDTLGFFTHTPADMLLLWQALGLESGQDEQFDLAALEPVPEVEPEMHAAYLNTLTSLRREGLRIRPIDISAMLSRLDDASTIIEHYEGARVHQERFERYGDELGILAGLVRKGLQIPVEHYDEGRRYIAESRARLSDTYKATPVILTPAATGPAPRRLSWTGDARMNSPWTALGTPAISMPLSVSGLPLGLQITAEHGQDARVLRTAVRLDRILHAKDFKP